MPLERKDAITYRGRGVQIQLIFCLHLHVCLHVRAFELFCVNMGQKGPFLSVPVYYRALNFFVYKQDKTGPFVSVPVYYRASRGVVNCFSKLRENELFEVIIWLTFQQLDFTQSLPN